MRDLSDPHEEHADRQAPDLRDMGHYHMTSTLSPQTQELLSAKCDMDACLLDADRNSFSICQAT